MPVNYTDVRGFVDAADPKNYVITPVEGTIGDDGLPARPVFVTRVDRAAEAESNGRAVDLWLDRRMSPFPAEYVASCTKSVAVGVPLSSTIATFYGLVWAPPLPANATTPATDFANSGSAEIPGSSQILGVFPTTNQGDYATDQGLVSYKKRIIRRLTTRRGRFAHLPNYGVGLLDEIKRLAKPSTRQSLAAQAEAQIREEPETEQVQVTITQSATNPGLFFFLVQARTRVFGQVSLDIPVTTT